VAAGYLSRHRACGPFRRGPVSSWQNSDVSQFHFTPQHYLEEMHAELPRYDELQEQTAAACAGVEARRILELGTGTGETARRVLAAVPGARLVGIDESPPMLDRARLTLPATRIEALSVRQLQDALPAGPFELAFTALVVHHLVSAAKRELFHRVREILTPGGRFVLADVVVPERPEDAITPLEPGYDLPDRVDDQLAWLREAGFDPLVAWAWKDCAVIRADAT
jgi:tRNA (cmo5U34)-methyltransferase